MMDEDFVLERVRQHPARRPSERPGPAAGARPAWRAGRASRHGPRWQRGERAAGRDARPSDGDGPPYDLRDPVIQIEREALKLAIQRPALCGPAFDALARTRSARRVHRRVRELIAGCGGAAGGRRRPGVGRAAAGRRARTTGRARSSPSWRWSRSGAPGRRGARRPVRRRGAGPGRGAGRQPADRRGQVAAAAPQPGGRSRPSTTGCSAIWWRWNSAARCCGPAAGAL